jgi:hypothetical protein
MKSKMALLSALMMAGMASSPEEPFSRPRIKDNRQSIVKKACKKCGDVFETKAYGGYMNCKKCNGVQI